MDDRDEVATVLNRVRATLSWHRHEAESLEREAIGGGGFELLERLSSRAALWRRIATAALMRDDLPLARELSGLAARADSIAEAVARRALRSVDAPAHSSPSK